MGEGAGLRPHPRMSAQTEMLRPLIQLARVRRQDWALCQAWDCGSLPLPLQGSPRWLPLQEGSSWQCWLCPTGRLPRANLPGQLDLQEWTWVGIPAWFLWASPTVPCPSHTQGRPWGNVGGGARWPRSRPGPAPTAESSGAAGGGTRPGQPGGPAPVLVCVDAQSGQEQDKGSCQWSGGARTWCGRHRGGGKPGPEPGMCLGRSMAKPGRPLKGVLGSCCPPC